MAAAALHLAFESLRAAGCLDTMPDRRSKKANHSEGRPSADRERPEASRGKDRPRSERGRRAADDSSGSRSRSGESRRRRRRSTSDRGDSGDVTPGARAAAGGATLAAIEVDGEHAPGLASSPPPPGDGEPNMRQMAADIKQLLGAFNQLGIHVRNTVLEVQAPLVAKIDVMADEVKGVSTRVDSFETRLAALEARPSGGGPPASYYSGSSGSAGFSQTAPPARGPPTGSRPHSSSARSDGAASSEHKVFVSGFPRELPRRALALHWDKVLNKTPTGMCDGTVLYAGTSRVYSVGFPNVAKARAFIAHATDNYNRYMWESNRDEDKDANPFRIYFKHERSLEEREVGWVLHHGFDELRGRVTQHPRWEGGGFRLVTETRKVQALSIVHENDIWRLFVIRRGADGKIEDLTAEEKALSYWGVGQAEAEAIRTNVLAAARKNR